MEVVYLRVKNNENVGRKGNTVMDILTIGFITVIILFTICKFLFNLHMYRNSIYEVLYSGFTEYRMRKKSIEGMSESCILTEEFGPNRIIYHVIEKKYSMPAAFVTIFLTSGCYVIDVEKNQNGDIFCDAKVFKEQNIVRRLEETIYNSLTFPITSITVLPDTCEIKRKDSKNKITVRRKALFNTLKKLHNKSETVLTAKDINGIFMTLTHDTIEEEK